MPYMTCVWTDVLGSIRTAEDGDRTNLLGTTAEAGGLTRVWGDGRGGITYDALPESTRCWAGGIGRTPPPLTPGEAQTYRVSFPKSLLWLRCLVERCLGGALNRTNLLVHFLHFHMRETIVVLKEGNRTYPRYPQCDMFVSHKALNCRHLKTYFYRWGL